MNHNGGMREWVFKDELSLSEINVPRAALQFARSIAYPALDVAAYMATLHELSEIAADGVSPHGSISAQADHLMSIFVGQFGFQGNAADYAEPRNSFLNDVVDRRLGIPISLTVIFVDIANRLGLPAYGIGLPGHFITGIRDRSEDIWFDPFHAGRRLSLEDCAQLVYMSTGYEGPLEAVWFSPASPREILARMLNNLRVSYVSRSDWPNAMKVIQLLRELQPEVAEHLRDLGLVYYHQGQLPQSAHYLDTYLRREPHAVDASVIREGMKEILDEWVPKN